LIVSTLSLWLVSPVRSFNCSVFGFKLFYLLFIYLNKLSIKNQFCLYNVSPQMTVNKKGCIRFNITWLSIEISEVKIIISLNIKLIKCCTVHTCIQTASRSKVTKNVPRLGEQKKKCKNFLFCVFLVLTFSWNSKNLYFFTQRNIVFVKPSLRILRNLIFV